MIVKSLQKISDSQIDRKAPDINVGQVAGPGRSPDKFDIKLPDGRTIYDAQGDSTLTPGDQVTTTTIPKQGGYRIAIIGKGYKSTDMGIVEVEV